jgi:hypothetical protein
LKRLDDQAAPFVENALAPLISPLILIAPIWRHAMLAPLVSSATPRAP